jgi:predicted Zn-dependent protease with MMP-like domain
MGEPSLATRMRTLVRAGDGAMAGDNRSMRVSNEGFEQLVGDALDHIPAEFSEVMSNVAVVVEDWPTPEQLGGRSGTLLGLYEGIALTNRSPLSYTGAMPDRITIFQGPICARAADEAELVALVRTTVIHEIAHHFGISDERLDELGWN